MPRQLTLPFRALKNSGLLSSHWLDHRLSLEPEWNEFETQARETLEALSQLWNAQRNRVAQYGDEAGLEEAFIQPVFETLGWKFKYQTYLQGREPDYALFLTDAALDRALEEGRTAPEFWSHPTIVADAKAWHISLDRRTEDSEREFPPQQIEWYLDRSHLDFGILTNGKLWRLIPREYSPQQRRFQTYLECDLPALLEAWREQNIVIDEFLDFFLFFSPVAFEERDGRRTLIRRALEGSSEYRIGVGESLKKRAFRALELCIEGFLTHEPNSLNAREHLELCREQSFILLYRLLFIMFAEDRQLLPYKINRTYTNNRSLGRHRDDIASQLDRAVEHGTPDYSRDSIAIWSATQDLFDLVNAGHRTYGVPAYNGGLFDNEEHPFLTEKQIPDYYMARIIDELSRAPDPEEPDRGLFRVDYRDLAIQHLGSIYEGLLELRPHHASERMIVVNRRVQGRLDERVLRATEDVPEGYALTDISYRKGTIYLQTDKGERRASGSYYTPDHIVDYIVENTLGPLCKRVSDGLRRAIAEAQARGDGELVGSLQGDYDDRILRLRVLDPAMGSGHFLIRACQFLGEDIATHPLSGDRALAEVSDGESAVSFWKRRVAECCLYGVDLNPLAVELAKLALWLETVAINRPLTYLDHHLRTGNSLFGARLAELGALPQEIELRASTVAQQVEEQLPILLAPLGEIRQTPSDSVEQIKRKDKLYAKFEKAREPVRLVADLWTSAFVDPQLTEAQFQQAIDVVARPRRFAQIAQQPWFVSAINHTRRADIRPFHWELEFLDAFYAAGRRPDAGFDAVIGNPPYDVLSELESGRDLTAFKQFIEHEPAYQPSATGKNNLYKLFVCRSLELLALHGRFGFITPMAILGDQITAALRKEMIRVASFTGIDAFPQKDNPRNRVFPEAKLSTAVFTMVKDATVQAPFRARVHAGRDIEPQSPGYTLKSADIPLYDPINFTIVSCDQADWNLAVRIMQSGRLSRLRTFAEFSQGEVNETNARREGLLTNDTARGKLVTRGASICLYVTREASQGRDLLIDVDRFLDGKGDDTKAFHFQHRRVCWQESSPQNNFRRVIGALVPAGHFCNHKINYLPEHKSKLPLEFVLGLLNSKLSDWYFRLGSTNAAVSHYQLYNLPCPIFSDVEVDLTEVEQHRRFVRAGNLDEAFRTLQTELVEPPFGLIVQDAIIEAVHRIIEIENQRGDIRRVDRSALDPHAQPFQDFIDRLFYAMAGLSDDEARGLEARLATMQ